MADRSKIEWTQATWNPVTGCTKVSLGCDHCYAETFAERWRGIPGHPYEHGFDLTLRPERLDQPLRWKRPRRIFVNSMSDLFHDQIPDEYIARVWQVMATTPRHTYQILTKRHARMRAWVNRCAVSPGGWITHDGTDPRGACDGIGVIVGYPKPATQRELRGPRGGKPRSQPQPVAYGWPLPNVWLGVSVENQQWADIRIPALLATPAAVRWLSCEPLLGPIELPFVSEVDTCTCYGGSLPGIGHEPGCGTEPGPAWGNLHWVVTGGESGPGFRPADPDWFRSIRDQCVAAGVAYLHKQHGGRTPKAGGRELDGREWNQYPDAARWTPGGGE